MDSVVYWYKTEVQFWRSAGSLFWSVVCLPPLTVFFVLLSQLSLLHPWMGLSGFLSVIFSSAFVLWLGSLMAVLIVVGLSATFTVMPDISATRLHSYLNLLRWSRLVHLMVSALGGACIAWCCSHLMSPRFHGLTTVVTTDRELLFLNESHLFLVLSGFVVGLVYYSDFYLAHRNYLAFPILQRDKYFRTRGEVVELIKRGLSLVKRHLKLFYFGYWFFGGTYRSWVMGVLNADGISQEQPLDTIYGLLDLSLLWQTSLCAFFIIFTWSLTALLYRVYHTQRLEIALLPAFSADSKHCLTEALVSQSAPLLQHLAFLDLAHLSGHSPERRLQVFSLSQPGGHAHTWRGVCGACLQQVESLAAQVHSAHLAALAALPVQQLPTDRIFSTAGDTSLVYRGSSQSAAMSPGTDNIQLSPAPAPAPPARMAFTSKLYSGLKDKPILSYFLMELPDSKSRQLFASSQVHIWAIEALSQLAAASYQEDKYGVVQLTLSAIFSALISLHDNLEKYFKLQPIAVRRASKECQPLPHVPLCQQLRVTLKSAIYRLTNTFGKHLGDIHLSNDAMKRLRPFLEYKE